MPQPVSIRIQVVIVHLGFKVTRKAEALCKNTQYTILNTNPRKQRQDARIRTHTKTSLEPDAGVPSTIDDTLIKSLASFNC